MTDPHFHDENDLLDFDYSDMDFDDALVNPFDLELDDDFSDMDNFIYNKKHSNSLNNDNDDLSEYEFLGEE